jgi:hypothetical protein
LNSGILIPVAQYAASQCEKEKYFQKNYSPPFFAKNRQVYKRDGLKDRFLIGFSHPFTYPPVFTRAPAQSAWPSAAKNSAFYFDDHSCKINGGLHSRVIA